MRESIKYPELKGICKYCKYKCGRVENPLFTGVDKCEYCSKEVMGKQMNLKEIINGRNLERY